VGAGPLSADEKIYSSLVDGLEPTPSSTPEE